MSLAGLFAGSAQAPPMGLASACAFVVLMFASAVLCAKRPHLSLVLLFASVPFNFSHAIGSTTIDAAKAVAIGTLVSIVVRGHAKLLWPLGPFERAFTVLGVALALLDAVGITHAENHGVCIREALKATQYVLFFAIAQAVLRTSTVRADSIIPWLSGLSIFVGISAAIDAFAFHSSVLAVGPTLLARAAGVLEGPNQLSGYLQLLIPLSLGDSIATRNSMRRSLSVVAAGFGSAMLVLTYSRAGLGTGAAAIALTVLLSPAVAQLPRRVKAAVTIITIAGLGVASIAFRALAHRAVFEDVEALNGLATRGELWHAAVVLWQRQPIFGIGAGNYELELPSTGLLGVRTHANNLYLQTLAEGGIVSTAILAANLASALVGLYLKSRASWIAAAVLAATLGILAHQFFDDLFFFPKVGLTWWLLVALGLSHMRSSSRGIAESAA